MAGWVGDGRAATEIRFPFSGICSNWNECRLPVAGGQQSNVRFEGAKQTNEKLRDQGLSLVFSRPLTARVELELPDVTRHIGNRMAQMVPAPNPGILKAGNSSVFEFFPDLVIGRKSLFPNARDEQRR